MIEIQVGPQEWVAFPAERLPQILDDEIKKVLKEWHEACHRVTADDIKKWIPLVYPKTNILDPIQYPGISKFDRTKWIQDGSPYLDKSGWIALCEVIARKDSTNLQCVLDLAETMNNL